MAYRSKQFQFTIQYALEDAGINNFDWRDIERAVHHAMGKARKLPWWACNFKQIYQREQNASGDPASANENMALAIAGLTIGAMAAGEDDLMTAVFGALHEYQEVVRRSYDNHRSSAGREFYEPIGFGQFEEEWNDTFEGAFDIGTALEAAGARPLMPESTDIPDEWEDERLRALWAEASEEEREFMADLAAGTPRTVAGMTLGKSAGAGSDMVRRLRKRAEA